MPVAQKLRCRIESIIDHGQHVYTVELKPERPAPKFQPGQFLHLSLDPYDPSSFWPDSRVFSIASSPAQRERLRLSYSVRGRFTARMEHELEAGQTVWIKLPFGDFVIDEACDVALFAGGTGITAFTAYLDGLSPDHPHDVYVAYGAREPGLLVYQALILRQARAIPHLHPLFFVENGAEQLSGAGSPATFPGRVSVDAVWPLIRDAYATVYYISGPPVMIKTLSHDLESHGVRAESIRIDAWE